ncbi:11S globulin subunit beta-like [Salvia miltiorrhiza]|uniref:11S globulin subunit beta-like n=1 Tax=Salvia miltiorrhiza TaxID=226208 RepID=UPI0025ACB997|nr:11S globulin subunit beta-like [Salvia miltiorrhiza]
MAKLSLSVVSFLLVLGLGCATHVREGSWQVGECQISNIDAREPSYTVRSEGGETEFWDNRNDEFRCAGVSIRRHRIQQRGLLLPVYHNAPVLVYVVQGRGTYGVLNSGCPETFEAESAQQQYSRKERGERSSREDRHQKVEDVKQGDVIAVRAGEAHWVYNDGDQELVLVVFHHNANYANQLDQNPRSFFLAGNPNNEQEEEQVCSVVAALSDLPHQKGFLEKDPGGVSLARRLFILVEKRYVKSTSSPNEALKGSPGAVKKPGADDDANNKSGMSDEDWEDLDLKAASTIRLCLAKNVLANVHGISSAKELWEKLEALYQAKGISNRLYLKEQFHTLRMDEGVKISDHLSILNGIISELESIGAKIEDEDKALRLILSLPRSYEHMKPILVYGKETLVFAEVTGKLLLEERRLMSEGRPSSENSAMVAFSRGRKKDSKGVVCWRCGKPGHTKRNCPGGACQGGADSAESSERAANIVFDDNAIFSPHWYANAHSLIYVTRGASRVQIVNHRGHAVFDGQLREGQVVVVPQNFTVVKQAGEEGFEWVAFNTNDNAIINTLSGRTSAIRGLPVDVVANAYQVSREEAERLKFSRRETVIFSGTQRRPASA